jgi:PPM family protein phosphatase
MPHRLIAFGHSDVGRARKVNEDSFWVHNGQQVWMIADGMGGHVAGQVASQIAVEEMGRFLTETRHQRQFVWPFKPDVTKSVEVNALTNALRIANVRIYNRGVKEPKYFGMGTTAVAAMRSSSDEILIATVGDSRCYRYRRGQLVQLTVDDSLLNHLIYKLKVSPEEARGKVGTNVIVKALGLEIDVEVEITSSTLIEGDIFIMCSDGLTDLVPDHQISEMIQRYAQDLHILTHQLITQANQAGGTDNISVICLLAKEENTPTMV